MTQAKRVIALVGAYRKGGVVDSTVNEILSAARDRGAETTKIYLMDKQIGFCANCRNCTQTPGADRGSCEIEDDMASLLDLVEAHDAIVLASPMNFFSVTAVTKIFIERLICLTYWPWGAWQPVPRHQGNRKPSVIVAATAAPALMTLPYNHIIRIMKKAVDLLGGQKPWILLVGTAALKPDQPLSERTKRKAQRLGRKLVG